MAVMEPIWQQYLAQGGEPSPTAFGVWLIRNNPPLTLESDARAQSGRFATDEQGYPTGYASMDHTVRSAILLGRLERFLHQFTKPALKAAAITEDEFVVLATLLYMPRAAKTQLLRQCIIEIPTGSELLKRMKHAGLILEKQNPDDGRSSFISISAKGRQQLIKAFRHLAGLEDALAALGSEEKETLLQLLDRLDLHHSRRHDIKQVKELMQAGFHDQRPL